MKTLLKFCRSGDRNLIEENFPEIRDAVSFNRSGVAWNQDVKFLIR